MALWNQIWDYRGGYGIPADYGAKEFSSTTQAYVARGHWQVRGWPLGACMPYPCYVARTRSRSSRFSRRFWIESSASTATQTHGKNTGVMRSVGPGASRLPSTHLSLDQLQHCVPRPCTATQNYRRQPRKPSRNKHCRKKTKKLRDKALASLENICLTDFLR